MFGCVANHPELEVHPRERERTRETVKQRENESFLSPYEKRYFSFCGFVITAVHPSGHVGMRGGVANTAALETHRWVE